MSKQVLIGLLALIVLLPVVSAVQFTVITDQPTNTSLEAQKISTTCVYSYGSKCTQTIDNDGLVPTECTFANHDCSVNAQTRAIILDYPKAGLEVPNTPTLQVTDHGVVCINKNCVPYDISLSVINLNWRVESETGAQIWVFVSPNGYNVIPILTFAIIIFLLWRTQNQNHNR